MEHCLIVDEEEDLPLTLTVRVMRQLLLNGRVLLGYSSLAGSDQKS